MVEFEVKEIVEVLLVAILGVVILFFVVGGGGRMGPLWDKFCEWMPQLCGEGDTSIEYEMSSQSASALTAAINAVIKGDKEYPGLSSFKPSSSAPAGGTGVAGLQTAPADATKIEVKTTVTCEDGDIHKLEEIEFFAGTESQAEDYCKSTCEEGCDVSVNKKGDIAYHVSQKEKTMVRCDCYCKENSLPDSPATDEGSFMGLTGQVTSSKCSQKCGAKWPEVKNCRNIDVDLSKPNEESTKLYNEILQKDVEIVSGVLKQCICKNKNDDSDKYYAYVGPDEYVSTIETCASWSNYEYEAGSCSELNGRLLLYKDDDITPQVRSISRFECEKTTTTIECIVHDFKLPQKVGDVQTYVINYGDPKFLYYWNEFPIEENSWTFKPDWKVHAIIGIVTFLPPTKVAGVGIKMGWEAIKKGGGNLVKKAFKKATGREMVQMTLPGMKAAIKPAVAKVFSWALLREELEQIVKKRLTLKGVKRMAIKGVFLETAYHAAILADSMSENYKPHSNNMVLKSPFEDAELLSLEDGWEKRPVLVKWKRKPTLLHGTDLVSAHLVSPCYLKEVNVKKMSIRCKDYTFDSEEKSTTCTHAKTKNPGKDDITCGVFDESVDKYLDYDGIYDKMTSFLKMSDRRILEHEPSGSKTSDGDDIMKIKKIYLPHKLLETGETYYISDIELNSAESPKGMKNPCEPLTTFYYNLYSAKLYRGNTEVKDIEMKCKIFPISHDIDRDEFCIIRDDDVAKKPFEYVIIEGDENDETGIFNTEKIATDECDLRGFRIEFGDGDEDGNWDSLEANDDEDSIILSEIDSNGNFKNIGTSERFPAVFGDTGEGCYISGIVIDLTDPDLLDRQKATGITGNDNYCVWHVSKAEAWKGDIADALTIIGYGVALYFGGPLGVFIVAATTGFQVYTEISADYKGAWP